MTDYGHPLTFGTFITPSNNPPVAPVELAVLSEQLGYDLVTFQDHPYQPGFHDTWTLLSWAAARTSRIHLSGNVLNVPLRQPAVLARAAASLDLLSGGRLDLALGAGGFWDAIGAMGGTKLTPGQGVDALSQAIEVIRAIWDPAGRAAGRVGGEYHHIEGAKRGPTPAHDIPIWVGARKPRMQSLIGRQADGWLPSLSWLEPGDLARGNAVIDEAAVEAGRDPREIRRLVNIGGRFAPTRTGRLQGPPDAWIDDLLPLVLDDGVGTFILASDDPRTLQTFADEVIPALRDAVDAARATAGTPTGRVRTSVARGLRRDGIDYDALPADVASFAIEPGDATYSRVRNTYMRGGAPGLVLQPGSTAEVVAALAAARAVAPGVPFGVRSRGHGISGRSTNDGGVILDLSRLDEIEVLDESRRLVRLGPGARWMDVAAALDRHGWALTSGDYGGVGVGGLATAGGVGLLARSQGLTIDHVRAAEIVLASGEVVRASATEHPDLFWAVRGAGGNFGVVTSFEVEVDAVGEVAWAQLVFDAAAAPGGVAGFLEAWGAAVEAAPRELTSFLLMGSPRPGQPHYAQVYSVVASDDADTVLGILQPLAEIAPLLDQSVSITSYASVMANASEAEQQGQGEPVSHSGNMTHLTPELAAGFAELIEAGVTPFFSMRSLGGAVADVEPDATPWRDRSAAFSVAAIGRAGGRFDAAFDALRLLFSGLYLSFETDTRPERLVDAFGEAGLARLRELKARYDPDNIFRDNFNVTPR